MIFSFDERKCFYDFGGENVFYSFGEKMYSAGLARNSNTMILAGKCGFMENVFLQFSREYIFGFGRKCIFIVLVRKYNFTVLAGK